jgi:hypothetical protein
MYVKFLKSKFVQSKFKRNSEKSIGNGMGRKDNMQSMKAKAEVNERGKIKKEDALQYRAKAEEKERQQTAEV